ncbi:MAG: histidine phosphatase family protein [Anaerolineales bacterium]|nr:histidine phosphatase family protein [Anaerolineales bacterium]MCB8961181.1 histidine phosphatase family protein [Ardenticatenales bacterium]
MADSRILLIRHSQSALDLNRPAAEWPLSLTGRSRATQFAATIANYAPTYLYSSSETKAQETAALIAAALDIPTSSWPGLQEHDRREVTQMPADEFQANVKALLQKPGEHVFGGETGSEVVNRFEKALAELRTRHPGQTIAAVSHGTAITLFLAHHGLVDPVPYWQELRQPALIVLAPDPWRLLATINPQW